MKWLILLSVLCSGIFFDMHAMYRELLIIQKAAQLGFKGELGRDCEHALMLGLICKNLPNVTIGADICTVKQLKESIAQKYNVSSELLILKVDKDGGDILLEFDGLPMEKLWGKEIRVLQGPNAEEVAKGLRWEKEQLLKKYENGEGYERDVDSIYYGTKHSYYNTAYREKIEEQVEQCVDKKKIEESD